MLLKRSAYDAKVSDFHKTEEFEVLGSLTVNHTHSIEDLQKRAWIEQIRILRDQLDSFPDAHLFLEFSIPRMGKRADAIVLHQGIIFVIEFKVGSEGYHRSDMDQVIDYALDLANFHQGSQDRVLIPMLVATRGPSTSMPSAFTSVGIQPCILSNSKEIKARIASMGQRFERQPAIIASDWAKSRYRPTPTIIEAAQALYNGHDVKEISRSEAGATNLSNTGACISAIIDESKRHRKKSICFVTGVPGSGKTLAGLNLTCARQHIAEEEHAVFLSGNGPLVAVLREALARSQIATGVARRDADARAKTFIQNIHHFRDEALISSAAPNEHVVVFDEAQRAWDQSHLEGFMRRKKGVPDFQQSEPEFLLSVMDRIQDWCTVVCLVGGGQEINDGEAGISEWFVALREKFRHWNIWTSSQLGKDEYLLAEDSADKSLSLNEKEELHLNVSIRSFRAEALSDFVGFLIKGDSRRASEVYRRIEHQYPIVLTRDLSKARQWIRSKGRGNELCGLLASSGGLRLKADGIHVKAPVEPVDYFLNPKDDVRSCHFLEDVATEFDVQGLELDWTGLCWDADLRRSGEGWEHFSFSGTKWHRLKQSHSKRYLENSYRVLLTRARQGFVIYVPTGDSGDVTRQPLFYESVFEYLKSCGLREF